MNYTNPDSPLYEDKPEDWLNSALIFCRSLGLILKDNEGIIVDLKGDMKFTPDINVKKVIVFCINDETRIIECKDDIEEGTRVILKDYNPN